MFLLLIIIKIKNGFRYSPKNLPKKPRCNHDKKQTFMCNGLKMADLMKIHKDFYEKKDKISQDIFILKWCESRAPKRHRNITPTTKSISIEYSLPTVDGKTLRVCREAFCGILGLKKDRIQGIMKRYQRGKIPEECRGGDRIKEKNDAKKNAIAQFIESFKSVESHYCRSTVAIRTYLPCDFNIKRLAKMYNEYIQETLKVKESYFRSYFNRNYNIGFGTPKTDVCSTCLRVKEELKIERNEKKRNDIMTQHRVHKLKAKAFFQLLKGIKKNREVFSIDCQKNLSLPKLPDQAAYFSQQYNFYNFSIVRGSSNEKLDKTNVWAYVWTDLDLPKNSSVISSALFNALSCFAFGDSIEEILIFADGCSGQNKNITMIGMLCFWLLKKAPNNIKTIQITFPVVGHSYMPPDRVFGLIERKIKKVACIANPEEYCNIIQEHATVRKLSKDWIAQDWKTATSKVVKNPGSWHFQFNPSKRFILSKSMNNNILVRGEVNYKSDLCVAKSILKKGKNFTSLTLANLNPGRVSDKKKARSVAKLLQNHFGDTWRDDKTLDFYKKAIESSEQDNCEPHDDVYQEECCSQLDNHDDLRV